MIIYNITLKVEWPVHEPWLSWLRAAHIPMIKDHGIFTRVHILRLLEIDEMEGPTYAVQFYTDSIGQYVRYEEQYAAEDNHTMQLKWGDKLVYFSSVMEVVQ